MVRWNYRFQEVKATQVEGTIYEFTQKDAGQPFVVEDSSGRVVLRDRGSIRFHVVFDTKGDGEPGGEFVEFLGFEVHGPHPGFFTNFCEIEGSLLGFTDSSDRYTLHPDGTTESPLGYSEYLPPNYGDPGLSPLLVFLHGSGESGDGSAEQLEFLSGTAIPAYIAFDGWPSDRPFVVLAPQHEQAGNLDPYSACDGVEFGGSCTLALQHDLGHPYPGSICFTPNEINVPRLRDRELRHRSEPRLPDRIELRRVRGVGIPLDLRRRPGRCGRPDRGRRPPRVRPRPGACWATSRSGPSTASWTMK